MIKIALSRVVFRDAIDLPLSEHGKLTTSESVFMRDPPFGRKGYELVAEGEIVRVTDHESGNSVESPLTNVRSLVRLKDTPS